MPELVSGDDLLERLYSIGLCSESGAGFVGVSWQELMHWQAATGERLNAWESETLFRLSRIYASMRNQSIDPDMPSPLEIEDVESRRDRISKMIFGK